MSEPTNIESNLERALIAGLSAAGVNEAETFLDFWRVTNPREARYPQISGAVSMPIPEGTELGSWAEFRNARASIAWATKCEADADRAVFTALEQAIIQMMATANATRAAWQNEALGSDLQLDALIPTDAVIPEVIELPNGQGAFVGSISFDMHLSVKQHTEGE